MVKAKFRHKRVPQPQFKSLTYHILDDAGVPGSYGEKPIEDGPTPYYLRRYTKQLDGTFEPDPRGGITTCELVEDGEVIARGIAYCSPKDNFNKSIGRAIAEGRARKSLGGRTASMRPAQGTGEDSYGLAREVTIE